MKQGIKMLLEISIELPLDEVEKAEFVFSDSVKEKTFVYPSDTARRNGEIIELTWSVNETYEFMGTLEMDTRITLKNSEWQPETEIVKLYMNRTLFKETKGR